MLPETKMTSYKVVVKVVCLNKNLNGSIIFSYFPQNRVLLKSSQQFSNCDNKRVLDTWHACKCTYKKPFKEGGYIFCPCSDNFDYILFSVVGSF
jgi:hypothetical protein